LPILSLVIEIEAYVLPLALTDSETVMPDLFEASGYYYLHLEDSSTAGSESNKEESVHEIPYSIQKNPLT
jgi:hypothetical protein